MKEPRRKKLYVVVDVFSVLVGKSSAANPQPCVIVIQLLLLPANRCDLR